MKATVWWTLSFVLTLAACTAVVGPVQPDPEAPSSPIPAPVEQPDAGQPVPLPDAGGPGDGGAAPPPSLLLTRDGGALIGPDGGVVPVRGAISCCGGGYGWPLFDEAWANLVAQHGGNFLHLRLGPFRTEGNGETDWAAVGGGYVESGGKADLSRFNEAFWARVRTLLEYARAKGLYVEVDVIDGWAVKHCHAGDIPGYSAWEKDFNQQNVDACAGVGQGPIAPGSTADLWVRKVVAETGRYDHVIYQDGNEVSLIGGYTPAWTKSLAQVIRSEEVARGYPRHLLGSNAGLPATNQLAEVDYLEFHQSSALSAAQCGGKPCMVNEYNPTPALTPAQFQDRYCAAQRNGTAFWYWRHDQTEAQMLDSLSRLRQPCPAVPAGCSFPQGVPDADFIATSNSYADTDPVVDALVNAAASKLTGCPVGSTCSLGNFPGTTPEARCQSWFNALTAELRAQGLCAGLHEVGVTDEIAVSNTGCPGKWYGYHACYYGGPTVVWNPGARREWWQINPARCP
jgi:hypothetical protein